MRFGARLLDSPIPASVPVINFAGGNLTTAKQSVTDWTTVPADGDMLANDRLGCCVPVGIYRWAQIKLAARYNIFQSIHVDDVIALYMRDAGYEPDTGYNDVGTDPNLAMAEWAENPNSLIFGSQNWPILWARVKPKTLVEVGEAMSQTPLLMTAWLPSADADKPENWVNAPGTGKGWEGTEGHEVVLMRNGASEWTVRSWGNDYGWHLDRLKYVHDLAAPLEASHTDWDRVGLDYDKLMAAPVR